MESTPEWLIGEARKANQTFFDYLMEKDHRKIVLKYAWIVIMILGICVTAICLLLSNWFFHSFRPGIVVVVLLWAIIFGATAIVFLSARMLTAVFVGVIGVSISEVGSGVSGLIDKAAQSIAQIATKINIAAGSGSDKEFIGHMVWLFIGVIALFCLPAFFGE